MLATRDSGLAAAGKLNMPEARLTEPLWLDAVLIQLLQHAAAARRVPEDEQDHWVAAAQAAGWTRSAQSSGPVARPAVRHLLTLLTASRDTGRCRLAGRS